MNKTATFLFFTSIIFYYTVRTKSQESDGTYCYSENDEDNATFLEFMDSLETFTFNNNYTIEISNCTNGVVTSEYDYQLDNSVVWIKRFEIYDEFHDELFQCRNCSTTDYRQCMKTIRSEMTAEIVNKTQEIWDILLNIKLELESNCVN